jgi:DNA-binding transcriptional LysR family regulator
VLNLNRLRVLVEVSRRGTLAEAARALNYTPSAVSQHLTALERETGVELLERLGRGVRLTDAAKLLVDHTEGVLELLEIAESELAQHSSEISGTIRVGSFQTVLLELAPRALNLLSERHPGLQVELIQQDLDDAHVSLLSRGFDIVLGEEFPGKPMPRIEGVNRQDFLADPLRLAIPSTWPVGARPKRLGDLSDASWALDIRESRMTAWATGLCRESGFEPRVRCESPDTLLTIHLVRTGHAVALIPALLGAEHMAGVDVIELAGAPTRQLYTDVRAGRVGHPAVVAVRKAFADAAAARTPKPPVAQLVA